MTKKIVWRLKESPTPESLRDLVKDGILHQDEARQILMTNEEQTDRDKLSLESEIKFLRALVEKLSKNGTSIIETIRYVEKPYYQQPWYKPYEVWCSAGSTTAGIASDITASNFASINTF